MNNDINNRMTTNNNQNKQTQEDLLMRLVDMMDEGHQLTDEEMALLAANDEAVEIYMQLSAMKHVVGTPEPLAGAPHLGHRPVTNLSARKLLHSSQYACGVSFSYTSSLSYSFL